MNILIVSHEYPPIGGGGANACMNLAKEYSEAGNTITIVTVFFPGEKEYEEKDGIKIIRVKSKRAHMEHCGFMEMLDYLKKAFPVVKKLAKEEKFDICQVFFGIPSGPLGYYLKRKYHIPYVIRFGGGDIPGFQDRFAFVYKAIGPAIKLLWKNADALVANSLGLKNLAKDFYDKKEVLIIPNGASVRAFSGQDAGVVREKTDQRNNGQSDGSYAEQYGGNSEKSNACRLLFVSRLIERKGLQDILPQLKEVIEKCKAANCVNAVHDSNNVDKTCNGCCGINVTLDIVGDGPYREVLEAMVKELGISESVIFHGQKSKEQLPAYYSDADVFLFPSRKEGMPNAVLEAMSYGLPIIMTPCQGSDELIDGNGFVTKAQGFGEKIEQLALDPETREKMGSRSMQLIEEVFSWHSTADKYLKLFSEIVR